MFWHLYAEEQTVGRCPMVLSMSSQDDLRPRYPMSRRAFVSMVTAGAASTLIQGSAAARAPDAGEDYTALAKTFPTPLATARIVFDGDEGRLSEAAFLRDFAGDLPEAKAKVLYAVQEPFHKALLSGKTTHAAWRSKPSFYAVSTDDRTINPDLERFMAKRMGAKTIEVKASHLSLISQPDEITRLILEAAGQQA